MFPSTPSVYPVFVADQVLTAHDLNESFNYLDEQERITRTNLIGIGIVCGLQVQYNAATNEITITKGCGITSKGYLISVDEKKYTKVVAYSNQLNDKTYDGWFVNPGTPPTPKITLWELKQASDDPAAVNITQAFLADPGKEKIVLLYVELLDVKNKNCDPNSCDDKGTHYEITFRPLLVEKNDALTLIGASGGTVTMDTFNALAELKMRRFDVPNTNPVSSQDIFDAYSAVLNNGFLAATENALTQAYTAFQVFVTSEFPVNPFTGLAANFAAANNGTLTTNQLIHIQYIYDLFSDFLLAYEEFRKTGMQILSACCPSKDLFPQHLLLGEAIPLAANIKSSFRHYFIYSPLFEKKNLLPELKSLFRRLVLLKEKFFIPPVSSGSPNSATDPNIRITPSKLEDIAISQKAIPYYYNVTSGPSPLYKSWNFEKAVRGASQRNLSYHAALYNATDDFVINPLRYDLEPYNFLRIEGIIGKPYAKVLGNVKKLIRTNRLPVDVIALNTENSKLLQGIGSFNNQLGSFNLSGSLSNTDLFSMLCHFQDLEAMYDAMKNEMLCTLCKELKYYYDIRFNFRTKDTATGNEQDVSSVVGLFNSCSPGYIVKKGTFGALIEKVYKQVGDEGAITIQSVADALDIDSFLGSDTNGDGTPDNLSQAAVTFMGYVVTLFEIPINIIRLANTFTSNLSSFDVTEYCRLHKLLTEKANSLKFVFNMFTANEKQTFRTEAAGAATGATGGGVADGDQNITTGAFTLLRSVTTKNSTVGLLLLIFILEDFFDHLDVLIYNCKCSAFKAMKAEYLKRAAYLTLLKQFGYFTKLHPGIQHKAGVPMGGTFIVVYHSRETRLSTGTAKGVFRITGVVRDESGAAIPGVIVQVKNTTKATVTSVTGRFVLTVNELPATLRVAFPGFDIKEVEVNGEEELTIILGDDNTDIPEDAIDSIAEGTVIADFYLPYRCCSDCPPIQYIVKEPGDNLPGNKAPIAVAGEDQQITLPRDTVTLDGNASTDPDGAITMYSWAKLSGPGQPEIVTANSARTTIKDLEQGRYQFELTVVDDKGLIGKDQVMVDVFPAPPLNQPPVVDAGVDQTIVFSFVAGNFVTLSGTATDPEGGPLVL
ncbi:MAG: carboxypeptidase-like regulatory domain-containing protein, partial [Chitinophagaceae bacterium]